MNLSFVIPVFNEEKYLGDCIDSIKRELSRKEVSAEIIVADNMSTDKSAEVALAHGARVILETKKGTVPTRGRGFLETKTEWVAFIDADCRLPGGWLDVLEKKISANKNIVCLSGPYRFYDLDEKRERITRSVQDSLKSVNKLTGYLIFGGNFVARRDALKKSDCFAADIEFYGDDTHFGQKLSKFGKVVFENEFYIYSSARRLKKTGLIKSSATYILNFIWQIFFHAPFNKKHQDIR